MSKTPSPSQAAAAARHTANTEAARIWAAAGGDLDRALDQRDAESASADSPHSGQIWMAIEDRIWAMAGRA